jgi:hypothetical protein
MSDARSSRNDDKDMKGTAPEHEYTPSVMLRNNPGLIRDCFWDGAYFVVRQIKADPQNGQDAMGIKTFRFDQKEAVILLRVLQGGFTVTKRSDEGTK